MQITVREANRKSDTRARARARVRRRRYKLASYEGLTRGEIRRKMFIQVIPVAVESSARGLSKCQ